MSNASAKLVGLQEGEFWESACALTRAAILGGQIRESAVGVRRRFPAKAGESELLRSGSWCNWVRTSEELRHDGSG